jgi:chaperonin GroEL
LRIIFKACHAPFKQILLNAGKNSDSILNKIKKLDNHIGYDLRNNKFGDMFELGVVDPSKVVRCAMENAASSATMLLSAESSMIEVKDN